MNARYEVFFLDESSFHLYPHLSCGWRRVAEPREVPTPGTNQKVQVCGAFNPLTGQVLSVLARRATSNELVQVLRKLAARARRQRRRIVVVLDNAQVHKSRVAMRAWRKLSRWIEPYWLSPYSPDLNDIERVWKREKERYFANWLAPSTQAFVERVRDRFRTLAHTGCRAQSPKAILHISPISILKHFIAAA